MKRVKRKQWNKLELEMAEEEVELCMVTEENAGVKLQFQVADVHKPLIAVRRLVEKESASCSGLALRRITLRM